MLLIMDIEGKVFAKASVSFDKLIPFGFVFLDGEYVYQEPFHNGEFLAVVKVDGKGRVSGKVLETEMNNEEFQQLRIDSFSGGYVGEVRQEYQQILEKIKAACFFQELFHAPQSNRIAEQIFERYGERPDFPWEEPFGVFRFPENRKWYGLIMPLPKKRLTHKEEDEEVIDVMNMKADEAVLQEQLTWPGVFPAYHMNHKKWISVCLDETLPDAEVMKLIDASRQQILPKKKATKK